MNPKIRVWLVALSATIALVSAITTVIYFFQPWRSCGYEDTSVGCAVLPVDATVMTVSAVATLVAAGVLVVALRIKERPAALDQRDSVVEEPRGLTTTAP